MGVEWPRVFFSKAPFEIIDGDRGINYPNQRDFTSSGYCLFLNAGNVTLGGFEFANLAFISKAKDEALRKGKLKRHDMVLTTRGTVGNVAYFADTVPFEQIRINSGMVILRTDSSKIVPRFLYLYLRSQLFQSQVQRLCTGSAQPQLPIRDISRIELPVPPLETQKKIAHILGTLDDKIELNRRTNETLEAMARAIFKSWFVDFDPVKAKAEGKKPFGMEDETAALFPSEFEDSELGPIPKGWRVGNLGDVSKVVGGYAFKSQDFVTHGHPVVKIKNITESLTVDLSDVDYVSPDTVFQIDKFQLNHGALVMAMTGATVGKFGFIVRTEDFLPPVLNQRVALFEPKIAGIEFVLGALITTDCYSQIVSRAEGSAQPNISTDGIESSSFVMPSILLQCAYSQIIQPFLKLWLNKIRENSALAQTRDILLPKLLSVELDPTEFEKKSGFLNEQN
jgi:type I restriction enzyme, S subunit